VNWPQFDASEELHRKIASAAREAEQVAAQADWEGGLAAARGRVREGIKAAGVAERLKELVEEVLKENSGARGKS
jgi:hypothetical protein